MTDLPDRILEAIEQRITEARMLRQHLAMTTPIAYAVPTYGPGDPEITWTFDPRDELRRCAADRKILTEILPEIERSDRTIERDWPTTEVNADDLLRAMAEGYGLSTEVVDDA